VRKSDELMEAELDEDYSYKTINQTPQACAILALMSALQ
jgi:hypothetical protein